MDPLAAGRALGVGAVLAGRILARGDQLVVNVELIEVSDGSRLWGERLSHRLADILDVEETIARQIAERLKLKLTGEEDLRLAQHGTGSGDAYREYLKGRFQWAKRTDEGCRRAIEHYQRAIEIDPEYALAYGGIADSYNIQGFMCYSAPRDAFPRARAAARRALELDPGLVEAKASLGYVTHYLFLGAACAETPRAREGVDALRRAVEASGDASLCRAFLAHAHAAANDREEAVRLLGELAGTSDRYVPSYDLAAVHAALGQSEDAFHRLERAFEERSHRLTFLRVDPRFRGLRSEERFEDLARRVGIPRLA